MPITVSPISNNPNKISFKATENKVSAGISNENERYIPEQTEKKRKGVKGFIASIAYGWVNIAEGAKGVIKGAIYGFLAGTAVAAGNSIYSGIKKLNPKTKAKDFKPWHIFNPKKAMSKSGRFWSYVTAGVVFVGHLIAARLKANKRTSNVDHMLYEGHRDK